MRRTNAVARISDDIQPTAILGAIGMIVTLMLVWASLVV